MRQSGILAHKLKWYTISIKIIHFLNLITMLSTIGHKYNHENCITIITNCKFVLILQFNEHVHHKSNKCTECIPKIY